jgi:hypothetical protein
MNATQACHCSVTNDAGRSSGFGGTATRRPWSPLKTSKEVVMPGTMTATASVTPARYGPRRRAAASPMTAPATMAASTPASSDTTSVHWAAVSVPNGSSAGAGLVKPAL